MSTASEGTGEGFDAAGDGCLLAFVVFSAAAPAATAFAAVAAAAAASDCKDAVAAATGEGFALTGGLGLLTGGACNVKITLQLAYAKCTSLHDHCCNAATGESAMKHSKKIASFARNISSTLDFDMIV